MSVLCSSALAVHCHCWNPPRCRATAALAAIGDGAVCEVQLSDAKWPPPAFRFSASAQCLRPLALRKRCRSRRPTPGRHDG
ncbi:hypothetical protein M8494_11690 [Serratia ureilytica]